MHLVTASVAAALIIGRYLAIVNGLHSWLIFDDDKIEEIKRSEIPEYFNDATSGSTYYRAVDLDFCVFGYKGVSCSHGPRWALTLL
jgi:hypothetical protein